jgi:hypothetical protein
MNTLFSSQSRTGIRHRSTEPRGGAQGPGVPSPSSRRLPLRVRRPPGFPGRLSRGRLQALPGGSRPGRAPGKAAPGPSQTPPFPGFKNPHPRPLGASGNRAIATRRTRRTAKGSDLPHYDGGGIAAGQRLGSTRTGLIVSLVDPQGARPCHRTRGRQAFAICLGLAELSRGHCTQCI